MWRLTCLLAQHTYPTRAPPLSDRARVPPAPRETTAKKKKQKKRKGKRKRKQMFGLRVRSGALEDYLQGLQGKYRQTDRQTHTHHFCERVSMYLRDRNIAVSSRGIRGELYQGSSTRRALRGELCEDTGSVRGQLYEERHTTRASEPYISTISR